MGVEKLQRAGPAPARPASRGQIVNLHGKLLQLRHAPAQLGHERRHPRGVHAVGGGGARVRRAAGEHAQEDAQALVALQRALPVRQEGDKGAYEARVVDLERGYVRVDDDLAEFEQGLATGEGRELLYGYGQAREDVQGGVVGFRELVGRVAFYEFRGLEV